MTVIMINCVTLGMYQPCEDSGFCDRKCQILKVRVKNNSEANILGAVPSPEIILIQI